MKLLTLLTLTSILLVGCNENKVKFRHDTDATAKTPEINIDIDTSNNNTDTNTNTNINVTSYKFCVEGETSENCIYSSVEFLNSK